MRGPFIPFLPRWSQPASQPASIIMKPNMMPRTTRKAEKRGGNDGLVLYIYFWLKLDCLDHLGTKIFSSFVRSLARFFSPPCSLLVRRVIITGTGGCLLVGTYYTKLHYTTITKDRIPSIPAEIKTLLVVALIKYHAKKVNIRRTTNKNDKDEESR